MGEMFIVKTSTSLKMLTAGKKSEAQRFVYFLALVFFLNPRAQPVFSHVLFICHVHSIMQKQGMGEKSLKEHKCLLSFVF